MSILPRNKVFATGAVLAAVCGAVAGGSASAKSANHRITLGQAIGSVRVGMTRAQVHRAIGRPSGGKMLEVYGKLGLTVGYFRGSTAVTVGTNSDLYATAKGIGPLRSTRAEVLATYPGAHCSTDQTICDLAGPKGRVTRFTFNSHDKLIVIGVALAKYVSPLH